MTGPLILDPMIRIDSIGLSILVAALTLMVVLLLAALPLVALRSRREGRAEAEPKLQREADAGKVKLEEAARTLRELRGELVRLAGKNADLRGHAADVARRAMDMVNSVEGLTDSQAHILRMEGKR